ncbi:DUF3693 domain-containing protein [Xanthomonas campestris pv. raphani]|uniref:DUF3693 domain-containing protein n=1 Tax=Xanthomonas campestris TaxID=339 RepID=UPI002B2359F1|nr:DUF3693 domain-containing protein [Xanthomonas campestris]MEA9759803.1 DUF3693 domain-containing protein [Xanthomonas campestris pv. raphani]
MRTIDKLLDNARKMCDRDSDRAIAQRMKVSANSISVWRKGGRITDEHLALLIHIAQADPALAVLVRQEAAETPEEKRLWGPLWDRLSPVTTVIGGLVLAIGMMPATGRTKSLDIQQVARVDGAYSVYYVKTTSAGASAQTIAYDNPVKAIRWPQ